MRSNLIIILGVFAVAASGQDLQKYFTDAEVRGSISIYDLKENRWTHSDEKSAKKGTLPASTFKIIHTLIGLEEGIVSGRNDTIRWNGETKLFKSFDMPIWNQDHDLEMAFRNSTVWYYEEISKEIKRRKYRKYLRKNNYSSRRNRSGKGFDFWNYGNMKVTPLEQVELLVKLYKNELTFGVEHQKLIKDLMVEKQTSEYVLRSKTGWCYDKTDIGWYIGYVEWNDDVIFFTTRIEKELDDELAGFSRLRKSITQEVIYELYTLNLRD